jgi:methylthioribulose-1-phosphate dehydratase
MPLAPPPSPMVLDALATVCQHAQGFYQQGLLWGTSGNLSLRAVASAAAEPSFYLTASGLDKGALSPSDFLQVNAQLQPVLAAETRTPSAEGLLHSALYGALPPEQAGTVYHVHSVRWSVLSSAASVRWNEAGVAGLPLPRVEMLKGLGLPTHEAEASLLVLPNSQRMEDLVPPLLAALPQLVVPAFVLQGHGVYAWGATPFAAKRHVEVLEFLAQYLTLQGG